MSVQRLARSPLLRTLGQQHPIAFRAAAVAPFSTKPAPTRQTQLQQQKKTQSPITKAWFAPPPAPFKGMTPVKAAMPQLVPFFFVNEVVFACTIIPLLVYIFSKYILPQRLRLFATRLFISKL